MLPFEEMQYHPTSEKVVEILAHRTQNTEPLVFRVMVAYYFSMLAAQMRCSIKTLDMGEIPVNMYALNLAPSGFGKGKSTRLLEDEVVNQFQVNFLEQTFPLQAEINLPQLANRRAIRNGADPDDELMAVEKEFKSLGPMLFSFAEATSPAIKQMRHKLLMANAGSLNLEIDEIGLNLSSSAEALGTYLELYDKGISKTKLVKSTSDSQRSEEIKGMTAANLLMFGSPSKLFDGSVTEQQLYAFLDTGYARRCFFGYLKNTAKNLDMTPEQIFDLNTSSQSHQFLEQLSDHLGNMADIINANRKLLMTKETSLVLLEYRLACERAAAKLSENEEMRKSELSHRYFKALKLAGAYAFVDDSAEVTEAHLYNAIKLAEESGRAFTMMLTRDRPYAKLAKYIANVKGEVTQADLVEDLPFYRGSAASKTDMMNLAIAYGYKNNIVIKKTFTDGIEFIRGETLKETDLANMVVSYSTDITTDYRNEYAPFDQLHKLMQAPGMHWVSHHLNNGYRNEDNAIPGFNLVVVDVDGGVNISTAKLLLKDFKCLIYTTKRHTDQEHRFRIVFPINYTLSLDAKDFKEFMSNIYDWLPFEVDTGTNQRARKWLTHTGYFEYMEGNVLDVLPFIPKTSKCEKRKELLNSQHAMDNLERWIINNTGDGNRNNMLLRYGMILVDAGFDFEGVRQRVVSLNDKMADKLDEIEIMSSIMITVGKAISKR